MQADRIAHDDTRKVSLHLAVASGTNSSLRNTYDETRSPYDDLCQSEVGKGGQEHWNREEAEERELAIGIQDRGKREPAEHNTAKTPIKEMEFLLDEKPTLNSRQPSALDSPNGAVCRQ